MTEITELQITPDADNPEVIYPADPTNFQAGVLEMRAWINNYRQAIASSDLSTAQQDLAAKLATANTPAAIALKPLLIGSITRLLLEEDPASPIKLAAGPKINHTGREAMVSRSALEERMPVISVFPKGKRIDLEKLDSTESIGRISISNLYEMSDLLQKSSDEEIIGQAFERLRKNTANEVLGYSEGNLDGLTKLIALNDTRIINTLRENAPDSVPRVINQMRLQSYCLGAIYRNNELAAEEKTGIAATALAHYLQIAFSSQQTVSETEPFQAPEMIGQAIANEFTWLFLSDQNTIQTFISTAFAGTSNSQRSSNAPSTNIDAIVGQSQSHSLRDLRKLVEFMDQVEHEDAQLELWQQSAHYLLRNYFPKSAEIFNMLFGEHPEGTVPAQLSRPNYIRDYLQQMSLPDRIEALDHFLNQAVQPFQEPTEEGSPIFNSIMFDSDGWLLSIAIPTISSPVMLALRDNIILDLDAGIVSLDEALRNHNFIVKYRRGSRKPIQNLDYRMNDDVLTAYTRLTVKYADNSNIYGLFIKEIEDELSLRLALLEDRTDHVHLDENTQVAIKDLGQQLLGKLQRNFSPYAIDRDYLINKLEIYVRAISTLDPEFYQELYTDTILPYLIEGYVPKNVFNTFVAVADTNADLNPAINALDFSARGLHIELDQYRYDVNTVLDSKNEFAQNWLKKYYLGLVTHDEHGLLPLFEESLESKGRLDEFRELISQD